MNSRCRVNGSRTVEPQQHHSTQENGPSKATGVSSFFWRAASRIARMSVTGRGGFRPGVNARRYSACCEARIN